MSTREETRAIDLDFGKNGGLVSAIAQDAETKKVLMCAFMNKEAFDATLASGYAHYYSRSRKTLWKKGETSGHLQQVLDVRVDCDQDCVLLLVHQTGAACHTGKKSCFYRRIKGAQGLEFMDD